MLWLLRIGTRSCLLFQLTQLSPLGLPCIQSWYRHLWHRLNLLTDKRHTSWETETLIRKRLRQEAQYISNPLPAKKAVNMPTHSLAGSGLAFPSVEVAGGWKMENGTQERCRQKRWRMRPWRGGQLLTLLNVSSWHLPERKLRLILHVVTTRLMVQVHLNRSKVRKEL